MAIERRIPPNDPVLNKPVSSYPTPVLSDRIIIEYVPLEVGSAENLTYGSLFDNTEHTAFSHSYPEFQLVYKEPSLGQNGWFERRVWCNPRIDQDTYNYSLGFMEGDPDFPIVTRVEVVKRSEYVAGTPLTPDTGFPSALLTDEKMVNETTPPEINSLYVTVIKTFTSLAGPIVSSQDLDENLNVMVVTERQQVLSTDEFNPTSPASHLRTLAMKEQPLSKYYKLRIWSYLEELPDAFDSYKTGRYNFPALVFGITLSVLQWTVDPDRSQVAWYPDMRAEPQVPAIFRITTEYFTSEPAPVVLYTIPSANLIYNGTSYNISIGNVLNDEIILSADFVADAQYGDLSEGVTFLASSLSATDYLADIGTFQDVGCDIIRFRCQIYVRQTTAVELV